MIRQANAVCALGCILSLGSLVACTQSSHSALAPAAAGGGAGQAAPSAGTGAGTGAGQTVDDDRAGTGGTSAKPTTQGGSGGQPMQGAAGMDALDIKVERSAVAPDVTPAIPDADYATFIAHLNKFGLALGQAQASANGFSSDNLIYSPLSVSMALAMTYAGARSATAEEMKLVLGDSFSGGAFHVAANRLARELASRATSRTDTSGKVHRLELNVADAVFVERTLKLETEFLDILAREYNSGASQLDFMHAPDPSRITINKWVEEQTKNRIVNLIPQGAIDESTRLVLVNAVYFYGSWSVPFQASSTHDAAFHTLTGSAVQVPTMNGQFMLDYRADSNFALADFPYEGNSLRMTVVLPTAGQFEAVRSQVSALWLDQATTGLAATRLVVALPKFKLTVGPFSLTEALKSLGMKTAFTGTADFTGMVAGTQLQITDVFQKAFIEVDEAGTEAAAATAVIVGTTNAVVPPPTQFIVDRPFLFFIRDKNGAVVFSGQVVDPSQQ